MQAAWPDLAVEESNLTVQIAALRRVLGEEPGGDRWIETLPRRGYRFVGPIAKPDEPLVSTTARAAAPPLPDKPSIAVMPFQNLSDAPDQEYFAEGMVEEIVTALSCIKWLFVIDRNSTAVYKGRTVSVRQIAHELGVRYVLEGAVRRASNRVRITAQLIDADTGANLWAGRFDKHLQDIFQLQDDIAASVAGVIEPTLEAAETRRSVRRPTADLTAYDLYLRARPGVVSGRDKEQVLRALDLLEQAIARDPEYATALSEAAFCRFLADVNDWTNDRAKNREESLHLAGRALEASGDDALVLCAVSYVLGYFERDIQPALFLIDRALKLNPSFAIGWRGSGWLRLWAGEADIAIEHFERSLRLNPLHRGTATFGIAVAHLFAQRLEMAAGMLQVCLKENPSWVPCHRLLAVCYAHLGRLEDARKLVNRLKEMTPVLIPNVEHWRLPEQQEFYVTGLRRAIGDVE
jgi:adenylate cyclase